MIAEPSTLPPVQCRPWCCWGDGHADETHIEDQWCGTQELSVDLSLYPPITEHISSSGVGAGPDQLGVDGSARPGEAPTVTLWHNGQADLHYFQVSLTPGEAEQLVEVLQLVLGQIGGAR